MHEVIANGLEDYLSGWETREFTAHLAACEGCREQVAEVIAASAVLRSLKAPDPIEPSLGFSARVVRGIREQESRSFWSVFPVDFGFAAKLAFASLLGLAVLGGYLATAPADALAQGDHTPEAVIASHDVSSPDNQQHLNGMLVTLATYHPGPDQQ